ncbi:MAG TPA: transglutaminase domain-containing protein, partial [Intrasporangiaceae bacterium]|nr:transglutaminase domain-containing protein [Intrasporangiaceae bacterium]
MNRARVADALLALAAVAAVLAPLRTLFHPDSWIPVTAALAASVTVSGIVLRLLTRRDLTVVLGQLGLCVLLTVWIFAREHLWWGLPTWQTVLDINALLFEARVTITSFAPPAPTVPGVVVTLALIGWVSVLCVDALAVTRRTPALAGIPLLVSFLISVSNSGSGLPLWYFLVAAGLWLILLRRAGVRDLQRWSVRAHRVRQSGATGNPVGQRAASGRVVGAAALLVAITAAAVLPHLPTRFLLDGLGRSPDAVGGGRTLALSSTVNLASNLSSQSAEPVLRYRSSTNPGPLRVGILNLYEAGEWREQDVFGVPLLKELAPVPADEDATEETFEVLDNNLAAPQLALPYPTTELTIDTGWQARRDGSVLVESRVDRYSGQFLSRAPTEERLQAASPLPSGVGSLTVDDASADRVRSVLETILVPDMSEIDKARAIQDYLRGPEFTYSLELVDPSTDPELAARELDPVSFFLETKQGYCTQFATAMIMMARAEGIPARFAVGFLPGAAARGGDRQVVAADAHAWPELYFDGVGWLRFEPTPATRTGGSPPAYTEDRQADAVDPSRTDPTGTRAPNTARQERPDVPLDPDLPAGSTTSPSTWTTVRDRFGWLVLALVVGGLGAVTMPASATWERRRRRRAAADEAARVEVIWQDLLERLDDVGITPPPDATPRQAGTFIRDQTFLTNDSRVALRRMVDAVEQARYARPGSSHDPTALSRSIATLERDATTISDNVVGALQRHDRLRATWW